MTSTIDIYIPPGRRRGALGKFLTTLKGLRAEARNPVPKRPRVREHDAEIPSIRTPNEYKGAYIERYEEPCGCQECSDERTADAFKEEEHKRGQPGNAGQFAQQEIIDTPDPAGPVVINPNGNTLKRMLVKDKYNSLRMIVLGDDIAVTPASVWIHADMGHHIAASAHPSWAKRKTLWAMGDGTYVINGTKEGSILSVIIGDGAPGEGTPLPRNDWPQVLKATVPRNDPNWRLLNPTADAGEFEESEHPRNKQGEFSTGGGSTNTKAPVTTKQGGQSKIEGLTVGRKLGDRQLTTMVESGVYNFKVAPGRGDNYKEVIVSSPAPDGIKEIPGRRGSIIQYDPKYAQVHVLNDDEPVIRREVARLKPEYDKDIPLERDPKKMFRGMIHEQYEDYLETGKVASKGAYNMSGQEGLTYWSDDPLQAQSYANGFASSQYKPTFERPCYVFVAKKAAAKDIKKVTGTGEDELGVSRAVPKDEVLEIWRGRVAVFNAGSYSLRDDDYNDEAYTFAGSSAPSADVVWEKVTPDTTDAYSGANFTAVLRNVSPGTLPFERVFANALAFPEAARTSPENWLPTKDDFKEGDHPRGQPKNAGEFAEKAGGPKVSKAAALIPAKPDRSDFPPHVKKLVLPPAWTNVHYNPDPNADLLAQGKDAKGRLQSVYSEAFIKQGAVAKFGRVAKLEKLFQGIVNKNESNRRSRLPIVRDTADVTKLIMETGIRPGSDDDTKAKVKAYGATTLLGQHVQADATGVSLDYIGKDGVHLTIPIQDKATADMVRRRAKLAGPDGKLFPTTNGTKLQGYVKQLSSGEAKPKDFRTYVANSTALGVINALPVPANEAAYKKMVREVAVKVSQKLGNTPTIALASYINPVVFSEWRAACCPNTQG